MSCTEILVFYILAKSRCASINGPERRWALRLRRADSRPVLQRPLETTAFIGTCEKTYLSAGSPRIAGGLFNESYDSTGLGHVDGVAALGLHDRRTRPFGHRTLGVRRNHLVLGRYQIPTRLG